MVRRIWTVVVDALQHEAKLRLLYQRHIDQLLLCTIYGVCKIMDHERTFKEIVASYCAMSHHREEVYQRVYVGDRMPDGQVGSSVVDIIAFYNLYFLPAVTPFLKAVQRMVSFRAILFAILTNVLIWRDLEL